MVRFTEGKPDKRNYRKFKIKTVAGQDDLASINEVVRRRYKRLIEEKVVLPDLVVIDGGPGQVSAAKAALRSLGLQLPLIGLAKEREEVYLPDFSAPIQFDKDSQMMLFLRKVRDEAHRFALGYNLKRREMKLRDEFEGR
jgi:excinuclease ABC subunit C